MKKTFLSFLISVSYIFVSAQQKIEKLDRLFDKFSSAINRDTDSAYYYCKTAYDLNQKIGNDYYGARCLLLYASYYYNLGDNSKCKNYNNRAYFLAKKNNNISVLYRVHNLNAVIFFETGQYDKALQEYQKTQYYLDKKPDNKYYGILHFGLGNLFLTKGDSISGIKHYQLATKYSILARDSARILNSYILIANAIQIKNHHKAHEYYEKAFRLAQLTKDKQEQFNIRFNQSNNFLDSKDGIKNEKALSYLKLAENHLKELDDKELYLFYLYFNYGAYYKNKNNIQKAIKYYVLADKSYDPDRIPINQKLSILKNLMTIYVKDNNYLKSFEYQNQFYKLKDSLFTIEKEKNYNHLLAKYEVEKKNNQIQLLSKENELQKTRKTRIYIALAFLSILFLLSLLFYKNKLKSQQKLNIKQQELNKTRNILEGQNTERNRLAKDLHDSVAANLAGINYLLDKENESLKNANLSAIQNHIGSLHSEIREISHNLSSNFIADKTFYQLLQHLSKQNDNENISTHIFLFPENVLENITDELKTNLYRIIQELLANIRKHADATLVQVTATQNGNYVCLMIEDNGIGFTENNTEGIGLQNVRERLKTFEANMEIDSFPGKGTTTTINFKL